MTFSPKTSLPIFRNCSVILFKTFILIVIIRFVLKSTSRKLRERYNDGLHLHSQIFQNRSNRSILIKKQQIKSEEKMAHGLLTDFSSEWQQKRLTLLHCILIFILLNDYTQLIWSFASIITI